MAKRKTIARRETPPTHIVTVDTNILWHEDKSFPVSPDFEKFWNENSALIPLELAISEVVIGELKFQQTTSALKRLKTVSAEIEEISKIASFNHINKIKESSVKNQVNDKIDKWLQNFRGSIIEIPINKIDWRKLIDSAIWRAPPFTFDPKDKVNEKGFRDALILETFLSLCQLNSGSDKNIVFVCNDYLLRETAKTLSAGSEKILGSRPINDGGFPGFP